MVRGTSTMMITPVDRTQQGQNVNILRAKRMILERERERETEREKNWWFTIGELSLVIRKWKWLFVIGYKCKNPIHTTKGFFTSLQVGRSEHLIGMCLETTIRRHVEPH